MNIGESLPRNAQHFPSKRAIIDPRRSLSYLDFHRRTNRLANYFLKQGIGRGDRVGLSCGSRAEHFEVILALAKIGAITIPYDYHWSAQECEAMVRFFEPKGFVLEGRKETRELGAIAREQLLPGRLLTINGSEVVEGRPVEEALATGSADDPSIDVDGKDTFIIMITSGTTGFPKACTINHETYALRSMNYAITRGANPDERALMTLPVHFNAGRGSAMGLLYLGGTVFIQERFNEKSFLETIEQEKITYTIVVPTIVERLLRYEKLDRFNTSSLGYVGITSGHLSPELAQGMQERICPRFYEAYASTDTGQITVLAPEDRSAHGDSVGRPIWCVLVKIADDDGYEAPRGQEGEICLRTPLVIQGYYRNPQATEDFFRGGFCHTGDIGFIDDDGYLNISGRKKNMVKSGGISVFPEEIEDVLKKHPQVEEVAVIGFKSPQWGEAVKAFVVLKKGASCEPDSLIQFCKESLASYKAPKVVEFISSLPRTGLGKIDRGKLEAMNRSN